MVYFTRGVKVVPGKMQEAIGWALRVAAYYNEHYPGHNAQILTTIGRMPNQLRWLASYDSLADFESVGQEVDSDPEWQVLLAEGDALLDGSSAEDSLYRVA